jgi:uroporphyrinogen decarboxylase
MAMSDRVLLDVLKGAAVFPPPIWLMRQAGRYLPEYRALRAKAGSFLDLCYNPEFAAEVTLQPIRRFGFDGAILFSDILVVPHALGRDLTFVEGKGPVLIPMAPEEVDGLQVDAEDFHARLAPVYETVAKVRADLPAETTLLGFCGAPWTVATYMIAGRGTPDQAPARLFYYSHREAMAKLLGTIAACSADYLSRQIEAGADAVQIFDSWAGVLDDEAFEECCLKPIAEIVRRVKARHPSVPVIGFPRGAAGRYQNYRERTGVNVLGLDWTVDGTMARELQSKGPVQGKLDPLRLVAGGDALRRGVASILSELGAGPFVFNLGHGIVPETPIAHVEAMIAQVRKG